MAIVRTAKGTAQSKTSGTTLTIASVTVPQNHSLIVGLAYDNAFTAPTTVTHSNRPLRRKIQQDNATRSIHSSMWIKGGYANEQTGSIVATWSSAIVERAMFATSLDLEINEDDDASRSETTTTTAPSSGRTGALITAGSFVVGTKYEISTLGTTDFTLIGAASNTVGLVFTATGVGTGTGDAREALTSSDGFAICCFGSEGPQGDAAGTANIRDNGSLTAATLGQRVGTTGGAAPTNITVQETYLQLTTDHFSRGTLTGATSRRWVNTMLVVKAREGEAFRQAISPSDVEAVSDLVETAGGNPDDVYFGFNEDTGLWEAYETTTPGTLRGTRDPDTNVWS